MHPIRSTPRGTPRTEIAPEISGISMWAVATPITRIVMIWIRWRKKPSPCPR